MKIPEAETRGGRSALGRRERKRRQVRDQLYAAALDLFVSQGYETTTMEQIAETADVARATVFNHFSQKVGFLEEWGARRRRASRRYSARPRRRTCRSATGCAATSGRWPSSTSPPGRRPPS
ncbi:TetR/AcrR family transcriptional regulator [Streptomyces sp. L7]